MNSYKRILCGPPRVDFTFKLDSVRGTMPSRATVFLGLAVLLQLGCKGNQLTSHGTEVAVLGSRPLGCQEIGEVLGQAGHLGGGYMKEDVLSEQAVNRARNQAAEMGATHVLLNDPDFEHGTATAVERNQQPALGHGDSAAAYVRVEGIAYKCAPGQVPKVVAAVLPKVENPPATISLLPLGTLERVVVYERTPKTPTREAADVEISKLEDPEEVRAVATSLMDLALDPIKYIPTHRIEFVGELGTQSVLYGFGYLEYAEQTYRLTTGTFEEKLGLVDAPPPEVESEPPALTNEPTSEPPPSSN